MELIILTDGVYHLVEVTKEMTKDIKDAFWNKNPY